MAIMVTCEGCSKKIKMDDKRVGTMIKCPMCKQQFKVPPVGSGRTIKIKQQAPDQKNKAKVAINFGPIFLALGVLAVLGFLAMVYFGPVQAKNQWDEMSGQAIEDVTDVMQRGLAAKSFQDSGPFDPAKGATPPAIHDVHMFWKPWVLSMPEFIEFKGTSSEGEFKGKYFPETGEIEALADVGQLVLPGVDPVGEADEKIRITGRKKGANLTVEINGKRAELPDPEKLKAKAKTGADDETSDGKTAAEKKTQGDADADEE